MSSQPETASTPQSAQSERGDDVDVLDLIGRDRLRDGYRIMVRSRSLEEHIVRLVSRGEVKFAIWGTGEEVSGVALAMALADVVNPEHFAMVPHYRSGALVASWVAHRGMTNLTEVLLQQQFSRDTDIMSRGRQMCMHLALPEFGVLPVQSPVGMQLGKAAGYALGYKKKGITDGVTLGIVGDGSTAEGDTHDTMNAISVWDLPTIVLVTDNNVAISTTPDEGRGIADFRAYAEGFGVAHFDCDGRDFVDTYTVCKAAAAYVKEHQRPCLLHIHDLPRFNGHSSAADVTFDLTQDDPLVHFGELLVERGFADKADTMRRVKGSGRDFFSHHDLGTIMTEEDAEVQRLIEQVRNEPEPPEESIFDHVYAPMPTHDETPAGQGTTNITYAGAIRSALDKLIARKNGLIVGQDVGKLGGVMQATAGLQAKHPERVIDAPLNEPLIVGTSTGLSLHRDMMALPEIQFGDYSLNTLHWLVYLGNAHWTTNGTTFPQLMLRMPTDPFGGGAVYHSMSVDGYFTPIPGLVIIMPSTSFDAHGLMLTAGEYEGPVVCLEPKWMYRQTLGPAFPGEPTNADEVKDLKRRIMYGEVPDLPDVYVPFGKGVVRRDGADCTIVAWGRAVWTSMAAAAALAKHGVEVEVIDLRTLVPPDMDLVLSSVRKTGRLVVAAEDRTFGGFGRQIQGAVVEAIPGTPTRVVGMKPVPGVGQSPRLEKATVLNDGDVANAVHEVLATKVTGGSGWDWVPNRYFIS